MPAPKKGNRGLGNASPEQIERYNQLFSELDVTGDISGEVPYVPSGQEQNVRGLAANIHDAAENGYKWILDELPDGSMDYLRGRVNRQADGAPEVLYTSGKTPGAGFRAHSALGIDELEGPRLAASQKMFDMMLPIMYAKDKPYGMTQADYGNQLLDYARNRYAYNGEILGKQTHHVWELNEANKYTSAIDNPAVRTQVLSGLLDDGIVGGDIANNFSALYGNKRVGKGVVPADMRPAGKSSDQHQGGVHPELLRLAEQLGLPNSRNTVDDVRVPLPREVNKRGQGAIDLHNAMTAYDEERRTVEKFMAGKSDEEQAAATFLSAYMGDLGNRQAQSGGTLTREDPSVDALLGKIRRHRETLDSPAVRKVKDNARNFLGMDFEDELLQGYKGPGPEKLTTVNDGGSTINVYALGEDADTYIG